MGIEPNQRGEGDGRRVPEWWIRPRGDGDICWVLHGRCSCAESTPGGNRSEECRREPVMSDAKAEIEMVLYIIDGSQIGDDRHSYMLYVGKFMCLDLQNIFLPRYL